MNQWFKTISVDKFLTIVPIFIWFTSFLTLSKTERERDLKKIHNL